MNNAILLKRNSDTGTIPSSSELIPGELAINTGDGSLFTKKQDGSVVLLAYDSTLPAPVTLSWNSVTDKPSTFAPSTHTHDWDSVDIINKPDVNNNNNEWYFKPLIDQGSVELQSYNSNYYVKVSNGGGLGQTAGTVVKGPVSIINGDVLSGNITFPDDTVQTTAYDVNHTHTISDVTNLQTSLTNLQNDIDAIESVNGNFAPANHDHSVSPNNVTKIGFEAALNNPTTQNPDAVSSIGITAVGFHALRSNTTGYENVAVGHQALKDNTTGFFNSSFGGLALQSNTIGFDNSGIGAGSIRNNTTGNNNTGCGFGTLYYNTTGSNNTSLGAAALDNNTVGSNNIAIGYAADVNGSNYSNCIILGTNAIAYRSADFVLCSTQNPITISATVGSAGVAPTPPSNPLGYLEVRLNGTLVKIPYYRA